MGEKRSYPARTGPRFWPRLWVRNWLVALGTAAEGREEKSRVSGGRWGRLQFLFGTTTLTLERVDGTGRKEEPTLKNGERHFLLTEWKAWPGSLGGRRTVGTRENWRGRETSRHLRTGRGGKCSKNLHLSLPACIWAWKMARKESSEWSSGASARRADAWLAPTAQPAVVATLCACLFLLVLKPAPTS